MKIKQVPLLATTALLLLMALPAGIVAAQGDGAVMAFAELKDAEGADVGLVTWNATDAGVSVEVKVAGLPPGFHGFHVHAVGECIAPFTSAGPHLNPSGADHPAHVADMPVLLVNADGTGEANFMTDRYTVNDLFGAGVIVHAKPDNYANIPERYVAPAPSPSASPAADAEPAMVSGPDAATLGTGDAGERIACGMIAVPKPA